MCLDAVASADRPVSVDAVAGTVGLHRSIVYRLLRTLEQRHLVERDAENNFLPGAHLAVLSRSVRRTLRAAAAPVLVGLAEQLHMTAFIVVADEGEAVTIDSVEPRNLDAHVSYRPGTRHPIDRGAPGLALLSALPPRRGERAEVVVARERGWAESTAEVIPGMAAIASPIGTDGAVAVMWLAGATHPEPEMIGDAVKSAAGDIAARL